MLMSARARSVGTGVGFNALKFSSDHPDEIRVWSKGVVPAIAGGGGMRLVGSKLKSGKGIRKPNFELGPNPQIGGLPVPRRIAAALTTLMIFASRRPCFPCRVVMKFQGTP